MELFLNDLSIHEQFSHVSEFRESIKLVMQMRAVARGYGRDLYTQKIVPSKSINATTSVFQAIQMFSKEEKRTILTWLQKSGPFWDQQHGSNEWFEHKGKVVTETVLAEAAYCAKGDNDCALVTLIPSNWEFSPIVLTWVRDSPTDIQVANYWNPAELKSALQQAVPPIDSWKQLENNAKEWFPQLSFTSNSFEDLKGRPFSSKGARQILDRLDTLNQLMNLRDSTGHWTPEGQRLYNDRFKGEQAHFSDSSDTEKRNFKQKLTFPHPAESGRNLFCSWHGKVKNPLFRIHFNWPVPTKSQLYVVYIGWKITLR